MDLLKQQKLKERFPSLFRNLFEPNCKNPLSEGGIAVNDGWYHIIYLLCQQIEALDPLDTKVRFVQIKEKFGSLAVYVENLPKSGYNILYNIQERSLHICEMCGEPGSLGVDVEITSEILLNDVSFIDTVPVALKTINYNMMTRCFECLKLGY